MNLNFQKTDLQENENQRVTVAPRVTKKGNVEVEEVYENNWDLRSVYKLRRFASSENGLDNAIKI